MGNTPLTIGVKVNGNNNGIVAGSVLRGTIYLSNKQMSTINAQSIKLKLIGTEEATIHYKTSERGATHRGATHRVREANRSERNRRRSTTREETDTFSKTFYNLEYIIKNFRDGVVPRGQFEFPFALQLPESLPSSMKAQRGRSRCAVYYKVVAEVYQEANTLFHKNPRGQEEVIVVAMPNAAIETPRRLPVEVVPMSDCRCLSCFSCTKIGTMALEAKLDRSTLLLDAPSSSQSTTTHRPNSNPPAFHANDNGHNLFGLEFRCQNKSKAKVKAVKATLTEYIEWSINGRTETVKTTLATSRRDPNQYPELDALWRVQSPLEERLRNNEASRLLESKPWRRIDPSVAVDPAMVTDTFRGQSIRVRHVLTLSIVPKDFCTTTPDVSTTVQIYRNPKAFSHDGSYFEPQVHHVHSPSAPFEDGSFDEPHWTPHDDYFDRPSPAAPWKHPAVSSSAPSSIYDDYNNNPGSVTEVPVAEALVLPEDWNAQTAELVTIPIAEATIVEDSN